MAIWVWVRFSLHHKTLIDKELAHMVQNLVAVGIRVRLKLGLAHIIQGLWVMVIMEGDDGHGGHGG